VRNAVLVLLYSSIALSIVAAMARIGSDRGTWLDWSIVGAGLLWIATLVANWMRARKAA
jgi:hypothetical protein